jgi:hypothetical protein
MPTFLVISAKAENHKQPFSPAFRIGSRLRGSDEGYFL